MRFNRVVFPLPDGPTKETKDEGSISKLNPFNALTVTSPVW
jgi:hypothetical protein